ncbi:hypothetical protein [Actinoplanes siamensis]|nr:hypothetical protein [Actinoplanes siamensis]
MVIESALQHALTPGHRRRAVNHIPPVKRRMVLAESSFRGGGRPEDQP